MNHIPFSTPQERILGLKHGISEVLMGQMYNYFMKLESVMVRFGL